MDGVENVRGRDKVELSLDGRQIASIVVGALVLLVLFTWTLRLVTWAVSPSIPASVPSSRNTLAFSPWFLRKLASTIENCVSKSRCLRVVAESACA